MKSSVETASFLGMVRRMIRAAGRRVGMGDIEDLAELVAIQRDLDDAIQTAVDRLRAESVTWDDIGSCLGITRQAAIKRYGNEENRGHKR